MKRNKSLSSKLLNSWVKLGPGLITRASDDLEKVTDTEKKSNELQTIISKIK